jgi:hypothetical protein
MSMEDKTGASPASQDRATHEPSPSVSAVPVGIADAALEASINAAKAFASHDAERRALLANERLREALPLIEQICAEEGAAVTLTGSNPDFNGLPNEAVTICNGRTNWEDWTFRADTVADCLKLALDPLCPGCREVDLEANLSRKNGRTTCGWCGHCLATGAATGLKAATQDQSAWIDGVSWHKPTHRAVMASVKLGAWMSAALGDPKVCDAMKADINEWFSAGEPMELLCQALSPPDGPWSYYHDDYYGLWHVKADNQPGDERDVASFCTLQHASLICRAVNASAIEARQGPDPQGLDAKHESAVPEGETPDPSLTRTNSQDALIAELVEFAETVASRYDESWSPRCIERALGDKARATLAKVHPHVG